MGGDFLVHFLSRPDQFYSTYIDYHVQKHFTKPYRDRYMKFLFTEVRGIFKLKQHCFPLKNKNPSLNIKVNFPSNFPYEVNFYQANTFLIFEKLHLCSPERKTFNLDLRKYKEFRKLTKILY